MNLAEAKRELFLYFPGEAADVITGYIAELERQLAALGGAAGRGEQLDAAATEDPTPAWRLASLRSDLEGLAATWDVEGLESKRPQAWRYSREVRDVLRSALAAPSPVREPAPAATHATAEESTR